MSDLEVGILFESLHESQIGVRCSVKGCVYPPAINGKCLDHEYEMRFSVGRRVTQPTGWAGASTVPVDPYGKRQGGRGMRPR